MKFFLFISINSFFCEQKCVINNQTITFVITITSKIRLLNLFCITGLLKVVEIIFSIAAAVSTGCVVNCQPCTPVTFMQFVSISAIIMTFLLYVVYALSLHQRADIINWPLTDLIDAMLSCILYLISSSVLAANAITAAEKSAIAFGYLCAILYGASVWFSYKVFIVDYRKRHTTVSHIRGVADHTETETLS